jgi:hypothetical protein
MPQTPPCIHDHELINDRQSAVNRCQRFAYSFVSPMLPPILLVCSSYYANRPSAANEKLFFQTLIVAAKKKLIGNRLVCVT